MPQRPCGEFLQLGLVTVLLVPCDTHGEIGAGPGPQPYGAREVLVLLRDIALQADLQLQRLKPSHACAGSQGEPHALYKV